MKYAIIGSGISGLSAAYALLHAGHEITLYEKNDYLGGHSRTIELSIKNKTVPVDTGFIVLNEVPKKGADNKLVVFLHPKSSNGVLIELCQDAE